MKSLHCFFVFGWIKLKFGVRGKLVWASDFKSKSELIWASDFKSKSKMQYQFEILRKMPLLFSSIMIFSPALPHEFVTMATMNDLSLIFFKRYHR